MNSGFAEIMALRRRGMPDAGEVTVKGQDPVFSARFRIGETTAPESRHRRPSRGGHLHDKCTL